MIIWDNSNGVVGTFHSNEWVGVSNDENTGIILEYSTNKDSRVYLLDGQLPANLVFYPHAEEHKAIIRGIIQVRNIIKNTYKFVIRAETTDGEEVDDIYCEIVVDNTVNKDGEKIGWKTTQRDIPNDWESYSQPNITISETESKMFRFELNTDIGTQKFYKVFGELPDGILLTEDGYLKGSFKTVEKPIRYDFTIRCEVSGIFEGEESTQILDREFYILVNPASHMKNPIFINDNIYLNNIDYGVAANFNVSAFIIPSNLITYEVTSGSLPTGLRLGKFNGYITGTCLENDEERFEFVITATCEATGGISSHDYIISTNTITYLPDIVTPEKGSFLPFWKIGETVYQEIIVENEQHFYSFNTLDLQKKIPTGLAVSFAYRQLAHNRYQSVLIISGIVQPQKERTEEFKLSWSNGSQNGHATFWFTIMFGKSKDLTRVYVQLPHEFMQDWVDQYEVFTQFDENNIYGSFKFEYQVDEKGNVIVDSNGNPIPKLDADNNLVIDYNNRYQDEVRTFDNSIYNLNTEIYSIKYMPKIYLRNSCSLSKEDLEEVVGNYNMPLTFSLSELKYKEYRNKKGELIYYVLYRDIIETGSGLVDRYHYHTRGDTGEFVTELQEYDIEWQSPTFEELKSRIDSADKTADELLEWQDKWQPVLVLMYIRPAALVKVLSLIKKFDERFIDKKYTVQYLCRESYFTNIVTEGVAWFFSYDSLNPTKDWRDLEYLGNTPIQPLEKAPEMPTFQRYGIITDYDTKDYSGIQIITDSGEELYTEEQLIIPDPE